MSKHSGYNHDSGASSRRIKALKVIGMVIGGVALAALFALAFGWLVMLLWNWLMPSIFGLQTITYWQGFGIVILAKLLFGAIGSHHGSHDHYTKRRKDHHPHVRRWLNEWLDDFDDDAWKPDGTYENWKYYADYWRTEGKAAFERYLKQIKASFSEKP
jgi:hypothetical protein